MGDDKKYVHLSRETIKFFAEHIGFQDIPEEVCAMMAEDCGYRLREATYLAAQLMRKHRRKKLTTDDFNRTLQSYDVNPLLGYGSSSGSVWRPLPGDATAPSTSEGVDLYFADEPEVDVVAEALDSATVFDEHAAAPLSVSAHWLTQEQYPRVLTPTGIATTAATAATVLAASPAGASSSPQPQGSPTRKSSANAAATQQKKINDTLLAYYDSLTKAILGKEETAMKVALEDLRTNPRISPLVPYFVNFVATGIKTVNHDVVQLTKLLHTAKALVQNKSFNLTSKPYVEQIVSSIVYCLMEPLVASINPVNDHWSLRDYAAHLLAIISAEWSDNLTHLEHVMKSFEDALKDSSRPSCSVYGAVAGLTSLGHDQIQSHLIPHLSPFLARLEKSVASAGMKSTRRLELFYVQGAVVIAIEKYLRAKSEDFRSRVIESILLKSRQSDVPVKGEPDVEDVMGVYRTAYEQFGSSLAARLDAVIDRPEVAKPIVPISLYEEAEVGKSGDEMLSAMKREVEMEERKKKVKQGGDYDEEELDDDEDEERSYESNDNSDFADDRLVVRSQISDPGHGIKLTLKLTKRSRTETPPSNSASDGHLHKRKKRKDKESSADSRSSSVETAALFEAADIRHARPPNFCFRVLGMNQKETWELSRARPWNFLVPKTREDPLKWQRTEAKSFTPVTKGKIKKGRDKLGRACRSCSVFSIL